MTLAELQSDTYASIPTIQRTLGGRLLVSRIVRRAVARWPVSVLSQCDAAETQIVARHYALAIERAMRREVGMGIILTLVLSALVSEIIKYLVQRWLDSRTEMMALIGQVRNP